MPNSSRLRYRCVYLGDLIFDFSNRVAEGIPWDPDATARERWNDLFQMRNVYRARSIFIRAY